MLLARMPSLFFASGSMFVLIVGRVRYDPQQKAINILRQMRNEIHPR